MNPLLAAILLSVVLWLTGCASTTWNAGVSTNEIDFKQGPNVIPKATFGIGGTF